MTISEDQDPLRYVQWMLGRLHSSMATASNVPSSFSPSLAAVYAFVQSPDMDARSAFVRSILSAQTLKKLLDHLVIHQRSEVAAMLEEVLCLTTSDTLGELSARTNSTRNLFDRPAPVSLSYASVEQIVCKALELFLPFVRQYKLNRLAGAEAMAEIRKDLHAWYHYSALLEQANLFSATVASSSNDLNLDLEEEERRSELQALATNSVLASEEALDRFFDLQGEGDVDDLLRSPRELRDPPPPLLRTLSPSS
eukprot:scaffold529_cov359-Ochromonas_danica.AAC.1